MSDPSTQQVPLPHSVDQLIHQICADQNQPPLDAVTRRVLASKGEDAALDILRRISTQKIRVTFDGFVKYLANNNSNNYSPQNRTGFSPPQNNRIPTTTTTPTTVRLMNSPDNRNSDSGGSAQRQLCFSPTQNNRSPIITTVRLMSSPDSSVARAAPLMSSERGSGERFSPQLVALGELEFRKQFLILNYLGGKKLEEAIYADQIRGLKDLSMHMFEMSIWDALGKSNIAKEDRRKILDWDSGKLHIYHCHVSIDGSYRFKGPYLNKTRTFLHGVLGDDNVLMVKFAEDQTDRRTSSSDCYAIYNKIARDGILVGLRRYRFFVFKDGGKEERKKDPTSSGVKCYFVRMESDASIDRGQNYSLSGKNVREARCVFMHVHTVSTLSTYMARFSLILSKTMELKIDLRSVNVEMIDDIPCQDAAGKDVYGKDGKPLIHTDGTGFISEDLALKCPKNVYKGNCNNNGNVEGFFDIDDGRNLKMTRPSHCQEPPLLIQFRLFNKGCAVKGTFLVNKKLPEATIQVRPSMIKVETDPTLSNTATKNSLEVVMTSYRPKNTTSLSRNLIALLSYGGVPNEFFLDILIKALEEAQGVFSNKRSALRVSLNHGGMDDFNVARMILSGIPLDESYLQYHLSKLLKMENKSLKGGKLPVPECYYLMGTTDPTGILASDEVCVIMDNGPISGKVLVYRNPGIHFGDIHVLTATAEPRFVAALQDFRGNAKYGIFFPCKGPRSLADEIAGGDFDGDMYFVSQNPELLKHFKESGRWTSASLKQNLPNKRPSEFSVDELEDELFKLFLTTRFKPSYSTGVAADSWLVLMDRLLTLGDDSTEEKTRIKENICRLIDIYYDALDAPKKSGIKIEVPDELKATIFPHYMERGNPFKSTSVLGVIYDTVTAYEVEDQSNKEIWKLPHFDEQVPEACLGKWKNYYDQYRREMNAACQLNGEQKDEAADEVIKYYKRKLYDAAEFEESLRSEKEIYEEALAIYHVVYNHATTTGDIKKCNFAWKVAGPVLCKLYVLKQGERSLVCLPSVLKEVFS